MEGGTFNVPLLSSGTVGVLVRSTSRINDPNGSATTSTEASKSFPSTTFEVLQTMPMDPSASFFFFFYFIFFCFPAFAIRRLVVRLCKTVELASCQERR